MRNNNYLSLINFKVKFHRQRLFINGHDVECSNIFNVLNMVSRGELELYVGCCNHGAT